MQQCRLCMHLHRIRQEFKELARSPDGGISVSLPDDSNFLLWNAFIVAPRGSIYEGVKT